MAQALDFRREGVRVGLIAALSVAAFYAVFDIVAARGGLYTINLLGRVVFRRVRDPVVLQYPILPDPGAMLAYSGLHLVLSLAIGLIISRLIVEAERQPARAPLVLLIIVAGFFVTILAVGLLTSTMRPLLPWWSIVLANALAVLVAGSYLLSKHPGLLRRFALR